MFPDESLDQVTEETGSAWEMPDVTSMDNDDMEASIADELAQLALLLG